MCIAWMGGKCVNEKTLKSHKQALIYFKIHNQRKHQHWQHLNKYKSVDKSTKHFHDAAQWYGHEKLICLTPNSGTFSKNEKVEGKEKRKEGRM